MGPVAPLTGHKCSGFHEFPASSCEHIQRGHCLCDQWRAYYMTTSDSSHSSWSLQWWSACSINRFLAACVSVTVITFLIKCSIIHQCTHLDIPLLHAHTPAGQDGSQWQVLSKWAPWCICVYMPARSRARVCVCACVGQVLTVREPGRVQGQHLWAASVCSACVSICVCVCLQTIYHLCPPAMAAPNRCSESHTHIHAHTH